MDRRPGVRAGAAARSFYTAQPQPVLFPQLEHV